MMPHKNFTVEVGAMSIGKHSDME